MQFKTGFDLLPHCSLDPGRGNLTQVHKTLSYYALSLCVVSSNLLLNHYLF